MKIIRLCFIFLFSIALLQGCSSGGSSGPDPEPDPDPDPPPEETLSDEELMDLVQEQTFKYFFDFAEPNSGMALERSNGSSTLVTTGGTGFGIAAFPAAVERGWIAEQQAMQRLQRILSFLEIVPTYHGAFSHWYDGSSAATIPFSDLDNGGDLVETAFLMQGLLINRQYFDANTDDEQDIRERITALWEAVEWTWYERDQNVLTWHWSPQFGFEIDLQITGYNEALMAYVLAASSPTFSIDPEAYHQGWAQNGNIQNGNSYYGETLPLGQELGGPLFFAHYSFIGLNPNGLSDRYANYEEQNVAHTLINFEYCVANPEGYEGYSEQSWGLTASDSPNQGYAAHSPTNDLGVITPTAAISSMPYTPEKSMTAMRFFFEEYPDRLWDRYGFRDAFSLSNNWFANSYLAIDQGPIVAMIENHRTGLLWDLFMADADVKNGLQRLDFSSPNL
jgi:hypothetical protein